jgi:hypothetical protein
VTESAGQRSRFAHADPLTGVVGLVSLVVYVLHGFDGVLSRDLGLYTYAGQRLLAGDPPYVGVLNRAGPLAHALPAVGIGIGRVLGVADVHGARVFYMLLAVACVCLVHVLVRDLTRSRAAGVVAATAFLGFQGFLGLATDGPREKTAMVLFLLAAVLALLHRHWATSGVFIALGTLTWQPVFLVIAATALVAALLAADRLRPLVRIVLGGAATTAVVLVYFAAASAFHTFLDGFVLINAKYTAQPSALARPGHAWASLLQGYGPSLWVILLGLGAVPVLAVTSARAAWRTREAAPVTSLSLGAGWLVGMVWTANVFNSWPDLFVMLPVAAIGVGTVAAAVLRRLEPRSAVAATVALALAGTAYAAVFSVTSRDDRLQVQRAGVDAVYDVGPRPATILSVQAPEVLVMTHHTNPSPYQMFDPSFAAYVDDAWPGGLRGYVAWVGRTGPTYIVMQTGFRPAWLMPWLRGHYANVGGPRDFAWWVSRSVGPRTIRELRRASRAARQEARS